MCSETQFCLRWNNYGSTMTSALNSLQQIGDFVDVTLATDGVQLKAHKVVLSACSPYFRDILKSNPCQHPVIILKEVNIEDLESVLTFMYEGEVSVTQLRLHTFMRLAEALQVKGLTESTTSSASSQVNNGQNMGVRETNDLSLDLTKKMDRISSSHENSQRNTHQTRSNCENLARAQVLVENLRDSPPINHANKRRKISNSGEATSSLTLQTGTDKWSTKSPQNTQVLEVKLEPPERQEEGKGEITMEKNSGPQSENCLSTELEVSRSPIVEETRQNTVSGHSSISPSLCSHLSSPAEKRSTMTSRIEKQPANYQPEFPQDPSCHHTLPYPCPFCEKSYTSWGFRRRHIKGYHTGTSELPCKWCLAVLPSHQEWESHVTRLHSLTLSDARNGILILEEAHMVLQIAQPTRIDSLMELIKNKKLRDKDVNERGDKDKVEKGGKEKGNETVSTKEVKGKASFSSGSC